MKHPEKLKGMVGPLVRGEIDVGGIRNYIFNHFDEAIIKSLKKLIFRDGNVFDSRPNTPC